MKTYRAHRCSRRHRTWRTFARCIWPRAMWISGDGPFASVSWCSPGVTVQLHDAASDAANAVALIDDTGCGSRCHGRHEVIRLERGAP